MNLLIGFAGIILTIFFVIGVHELGHFLVAKLVGVKVLRFSIGFGKPFYRWYDKTGTEYALAPIPLGGYVKLLDENEGKVKKEDLPFAYNHQSLFKRFAIVIAGPIFNLIFAFVIYWMLFMVGFMSITPLIGKITPDSIAYKAGLKPQQEILQINNNVTSSWDSIVIHLLFEVGNQEKIQMTARDPDQKTKNYLLDTTQWQLDKLKPNILSSLGIIPFEPEIPAKIETVAADSPAFSKLKKGDVIVALNNKPIKDWFDLTAEIEKNPESILLFKVKRDKNWINIPIKTTYIRDFMFSKHGYLGISPEFKWPEKLVRENKYNPWDAFIHAGNEVKVFSYLNFLIIGKMLTGKISFYSLGGPITIFENAGTALNHGLIPFLIFLAFLSISIGLINILPIPGLDGGHILFQFLEFVLRRPISLKWQLLMYRIGLILLFLLITQALVNDIQRL